MCTIAGISGEDVEVEFADIFYKNTSISMRCVNVGEKRSIKESMNVNVDKVILNT